MSLYTGTGARPGVAIAVAARLRVEYGVASWEPERLRQISARMQAFGVEAPEPEQVILIADSLPPGLLPAAAGLEVVGIALGSDAPLLPPPDCPTVLGLGNELFESVAEGEIVIVDGSRGRVYTSPDAVTVARYQSPTVASRRVFLDQSHLPARTATDGRLISVFATAGTQDEVSQAMKAGADGLFVDAQSPLLGGSDGPMTASEQAAALEDLLHTLGGLPLLLALPPERLALTALARASSQGTLHLVVHDLETREEVTERLTEIEAMLEDDDAPFGTPQFELALRTVRDPLLPDDLAGFAGIIVAEEMGMVDMERLLPIAGLAHRTRLPLLIALGDDWPGGLSRALSLGTTRLLVSAQYVHEVKDAVRAW